MIPNTLLACIQVREELLSVKRGRLSAEPGLENDSNGVIQLQIRMPDGSRKSRRFRKEDTLQALFDFIDVNSDVKSGSYQLVRHRSVFKWKYTIKIGYLETIM